MQTRRQFFSAATAAASLAAIPRSLRATTIRQSGIDRVRHGGALLGSGVSETGIRLQAPSKPLDEIARDEIYWRSIQQEFTVDRSLIHLNNGGVCPSPISVQRAEAAHIQIANSRPFYAYEGEVQPQLESIRRGLADLFGCDAEELALTRNTSEGMEIVQLGVTLGRGDEVLTTEQDYPRMIATWEQRAAREGIVIRKVPIPVPLDRPGDLVEHLEAAITPRTRVLMCCHVIDLTGQILPVPEIVRMAHRHGVPVLVDGAQSFGHFPFRLADLGCDYFATSLHKWLMGPQGTGMLYVRSELIEDLWPLMPPEPEIGDGIRKFEDVGTQSPARFLALGDAIAFHNGIGADVKIARLRFLRDYWIEALGNHDRVRFETHLPTAGALATVHIDGFDPLALRNHLWDRYRIRVRPIDTETVNGIRVSPSIYNTLSELDRLVDVLLGVIRHGLPTT